MDIKEVSILCQRLDHQFRNIVLLYEALTHDFDEETKWIIPHGNIVYQKKKYNRLKLLGKSVLKLLFAEQAIDDLQYEDTHLIQAVEGRLTNLVINFQSEVLMVQIGKKLELKNYIKIGKGFHGNIENLYRSVIYAIFGAVFIDAGGCGFANSKSEHGIKHARKIFQKLWAISNDYYFPMSLTLRKVLQINHRDIEECDCDNTGQDHGNWFLEDMTTGTLELQDAIKYRFKSNSLIDQALTHGSVKRYQKFMDLPTYEILKCLGDAVYELVICDYLYWYYVNDESQVDFNKQKLDLYTCAKFQAVISKSLYINDYILKASRVQIFELDAFLKSLIGAIYVDSLCSLATVKHVVVTLCKKFKDCHEKHGILPLPYSLKTYCGSLAVLNARIKNYGQPAKQRAITITNIRDFLSCGHNLNSLHTHWNFLTRAKVDEDKDSRRIVNCSEEECNRMEFDRLSLYRTAACILSIENYQSGTSFVPNHHLSEVTEQGIYNPVLKSTWIPECRRPDSRQPELPANLDINKENDTISGEEVMIALNVIYRWCIMWFIIILKSVKNGLKRIIMIVRILINFTVSTVVIAVLASYFMNLILAFNENQKRLSNVEIKGINLKTIEINET